MNSLLFELLSPNERVLFRLFINLEGETEVIDLLIQIPEEILRGN